MASSEKDEVIFDKIYSFCKGQKHHCDVKKTLKSLKSQNFTSNTDTIQKFIEWANDHKSLKVVTANIPYGILPEGSSGSLLDVKVNPKHGPDDAIYDSNSDIRRKVARGNCILELDNGPEAGMTCVTYGMKKFTGGLGDDDDKDKGDNHTWKKYFTKPLENASCVVCTDKANGEAAHLSAAMIMGEIFIVAGSKNVHMLLKSRDDIEKYTDARYRIAKDVGIAVMDLVESLEESKRDGLLEFLSVLGVTGVFEVLCPDHQHVEDLSHLKKPELRFIAWTSNNLAAPEEQQLCFMPPHVAIEIADALGLPTVKYSMILPDGVEEKMKEIRTAYNTEGQVLYFMDENQSVIGLLKKKTIWYILCRAIREKVRTACGAREKTPSTYSPAKYRQNIVKRLKEIQSWLGLDDNSLETWTDLGTKFLDWCIDGLSKGILSFRDIGDLFPVTWKKFLQETGKSDKIDAQWQEPQGSDD